MDNLIVIKIFHKISENKFPEEGGKISVGDLMFCSSGNVLNLF
jgi:hypothetical protein